MWSLFSWPLIALKKIVLLPIKIFVALDVAVLIAYLAVLVCVFCSAEGFQWCSELFTKETDGNVYVQ